MTITIEIERIYFTQLLYTLQLDFHQKAKYLLKLRQSALTIELTLPNKSERNKNAHN